MSLAADDSGWKNIIKSFGLVFGNVGTSPIYTLTVVFALTRPTVENVFGILSLVVWTLTILVSVEYSWLAMGLGRKSEGGTIVLKEILVRLLKPGRQMAFAGFLSYLGVSLLVGDGVITSAISILSAVEGMRFIPGIGVLHQESVIMIAALIVVMLFLFQSRGSDRVAKAFGPVMALWFLSLALSGGISIAGYPSILKAVSPHYAFSFMMENGFSGFFILSEVILCATGGEALYADMGHLGRRPIRKAWYLVFSALALNYLGQGAFILRHPDTKSILFGMVKQQAPCLYVPFLLLTITAGVIASHAMISGVFSIVYQGITTRIMPLLRVKYTSSHLKSQIFISAVNRLMMVAVLFVLFLFKKSENLASAYGLAVTGTMSITGILMIMIFLRTAKKWKAPFAVLVTVVDMVFLLACINKLHLGAYWSLIIASLPLATILIWTKGQRALYRSLRPLDLETFLVSYTQIYETETKIPGTGIFFTREIPVVPPYIVHCICRSNIIYERNVFVSIVKSEEPYGIETRLIRNIGPGLEGFEVHVGYLEVPDMETLLKKNEIREKVIFYGVEDITSRNPFWKIFNIIKKQTPNFVQFYNLPAEKLHGVLTRVEM